MKKKISESVAEGTRYKKKRFHPIDAGLVARQFGAQNILIGGVTTRKGGFLKKRCNALNGNLRDLCNRKGFIFINNTDVKDEHLYSDGVHLNEKGTVILADNYLSALSKIPRDA